MAKKFLSFLVLVFLLALAASADDQPKVILKQLQNGMIVGTLPNGLKILFVPMETDKLVVLTRVNAGFIDEIPSSDPQKDETGSAHRVEHDLFRGTKKYPGNAFDKNLTNHGIDTNANTNLNQTNYFLIGPAGEAQEIITNAADMIVEPRLADKELIEEARPVRQEIDRRAKGNPYIDLIEFSMAVHAKGDRLQHLMAGNFEENQGVPEVIRGFYKKHYSADNMGVIVMGGLGTDQAGVQSTIQLAVEQFSRVRQFQVPPRVSAKSELERKTGKKIYKGKTSAGGRRLVSFEYKIDLSGNEAPAALLKRFLNRDGAGRPFQALKDAGYVLESVIDADSVRDVLYVRVLMDLTALGEKKVIEVAKHVSGVMGTLAHKGLSDKTLQELKAHYVSSEVRGQGLVGTAQMLIDGYMDNGEDKITALPEAVLAVDGEGIKKLAAQLTPERMNISMISPSAKGKMNKWLAREVEEVDVSGESWELHKAFKAANVVMPAEGNVFHALDGAKPIEGPGFALLAVTSSEAPVADAKLEFNYDAKDMTPELRLAADLAILAFRLEPENAALFSDANETGVQLDFRFDPNSLTLSITGAGEPSKSTTALYALFEGLRSYAPTEASLARAKIQMSERIRDVPAGEVTSQALGIGFNRLMGRDLVDINERISAINKTSLSSVKQSLEMLHASWGVKGVIGGNWQPLSLKATIPLVLPAKPVDLKPYEHEEKPGVKEGYPGLVGRKAEVDRQGVARIFPVAVKEYSREHWAFEIFSILASRRLMDVARTEKGLVYSVGAGFEINPAGGGILYFAGDTSHRAHELALAFTVALDDLLYRHGIEAGEFNKAKTDLAASLGLDGAEGAFSRLFKGFSPEVAGQLIDSLTLEKVWKIVTPKLEKSVKIDSVAVGPNDPVCQSLLASPRVPGIIPAIGTGDVKLKLRTSEHRH